MLEGMSPIRYGVYSSPFGLALIGVCGDTICHVSFMDKNSLKAPQNHLLDEATIREIGTHSFGKEAAEYAWPLHLSGTLFQHRVWKALQAIPRGETVSYGVLARRIGSPTAARAVGAACGANQIAWLIPCHRVVSATGALGGYRWGTKRKAAMLAWERAANLPLQGNSNPYTEK